MADTMITVSDDSLAAATEGARRGERWTANTDCGTVVLEISNGEVIARPLAGGSIGRYPPLTGWTRADLPILCPRCGGSHVVTFGLRRASTDEPFFQGCECRDCLLCDAKRYPTEYAAREAWLKIARTPWHRPTERPEGGEQWLVVWDATNPAAMCERASQWYGEGDTFSGSILAWRYPSAPPPWAKEAKL